MLDLECDGELDLRASIRERLSLDLELGGGFDLMTIIRGLELDPELNVGLYLIFVKNDGDLVEEL